MNLELDREDVSVSGSVHREINDMLQSFDPKTKNSYHIIIDTKNRDLILKKKADASPHLNTTVVKKFRQDLVLVVLPTPSWVVDSKQTCYICFHHELAGLMKEWWDEYAKLMQ